MRKVDVEKLKKIHVLPQIIIFLFMLMFMGIAVSLIVTGIMDNLTRGKINEGYQWSKAVYDQLKDIDPESEEFADRYEDCSDIVQSLVGVTVYNDETVFVQIGETPSDDVLKGKRALEQLGISIGENDKNLKIIIDKSSDSDFYKIMSGDNDFLKKTIMKAIKKIDIADNNSNEIMIAPILNQNCYYCFSAKDGTVVCIGLALHIIVQDLILAILVLIGVATICLVFAIYVLIMIFRFVWTQRKLIKMYYTDKETGGYNWYYFINNAKKRIKKNKKGNNRLAIVQIRMDKYRNYCSCYGDKEGSKLVSDFYEVIRKNTTKKDLFARHDICDFALLCTYESREQLLEKVRLIMEKMDGARPNIKLYFKAGVYMIEGDVDDPAESYNRASMARAMANSDTSYDICVFTKDMEDALLWERKVENDMERALENHEYAVYLQPKYSTDHEKLAAAEALVRWIHPTEGFIPPYKFIPIFEKNGFILKLDDYMISEVAKLQARWISEGRKIVPISVNVSRAHFTRADLAEHICGLIDSFGVPHDCIELELTESAFFDDKSTLIEIVNNMKKNGFAVSMDDFGAGYSSLNSLKELPIDVVKLDAEFFRGDDNDGKGKVIVSEAIELAKKLHMKVVAEGIETREQVDFLAGIDCDLIQGYYFAKPMPVSEFESQVERDAE